MASILPSLNREDRALVACYRSLYAPRTGGRRTVTIGLLAALGGVAAWPLPARAQQPEPMRRIGVLTNLAAEDPEGRARTEALLTPRRFYKDYQNWVGTRAERCKSISLGVRMMRILRKHRQTNYSH